MAHAVAEQLTSFPMITYLVFAIGESDIIVSLRAQHIQELYDFVIEVIGKIPGVRHTKTFPLPLVLKDQISWVPPEAFEDNIEDYSSSPPTHQGE